MNARNTVRVPQVFTARALLNLRQEFRFPRNLVDLLRDILFVNRRSDMEFVDRVLTCGDCGNKFVFTAGEQLFFFDKQFKNDPKRCKPCKGKRQGDMLARQGSEAIPKVSFRTETRTMCSTCGVETTVPFRPTQGRPVLCRECFQKRRLPLSATSSIRMEATVQMNTATAELIAAASANDHLASVGMERAASAQTQA